MPPAGKENARKRAAPNAAAAAASPRDVLTLEVTEGPAKGMVYAKQARPVLLSDERHPPRESSSYSPSRALPQQTESCFPLHCPGCHLL